MLFRRASRASLTTAALTTVVVLSLGACESGSGEESGSKSAPASGPSVLVPGAPGEDNRTLSAQEAKEQRKEDDTPNTADVSYARMMIVHHQQALEMTELAPKQAASDAVKRLAERIAAAQEPEIGAMRGWLKEHGKSEKADEGDGHGHGPAPMPGMATEAQLKNLRAAKGTSFDQLFLTLMITHHEGAIAMATEVKGQGNNIRAEEMADDVIATQTAEIGRMRDMG
ncbi:DUF305 domain-containing protein [Streptomyces sp. NPDC091377]|uniref:DUF305 domain-containing protein n=1 Tax=unclassified Streptomyces TaxID=2593676 RepID=UPI003828D84F